MFCKYKDIFGKPNEGFHAARFLGLARNDLFGTIIAILLICMIFNTNILTTTICVFAAGIIMHWLFCVDTAFTKQIENLL